MIFATLLRFIIKYFLKLVINTILIINKILSNKYQNIDDDNNTISTPMVLLPNNSTTSTTPFTIIQIGQYIHKNIQYSYTSTLQFVSHLKTVFQPSKQKNSNIHTKTTKITFKVRYGNLKKWVISKSPKIGMGIGAFLPYKKKQERNGRYIKDNLSVGPYVRFEIKNVYLPLPITPQLTVAVNTMRILYQNYTTSVADYLNDTVVMIQENNNNIKNYFLNRFYNTTMATTTTKLSNNNTHLGYNNKQNMIHQQRRKVLRRKKSKAMSLRYKEWFSNRNINNNSKNKNNHNESEKIMKKKSVLHDEKSGLHDKKTVLKEDKKKPVLQEEKTNKE
jgi:hypothetical protein